MADAATPFTASTAPDPDAAKRQKEQFDKRLTTPAACSTGSVTLAGRSFDYDVQAAFIPVVPGGLGEPEAAIMATSYQLKGAAPAQRPVCFAFNGGPGSASIWLHLGALGPKRVVVPDDGSMARAPYAVEDNPHSWFEHFDLVFIENLAFVIYSNLRSPSYYITISY